MVAHNYDNNNNQIKFTCCQIQCGNKQISNIWYAIWICYVKDAAPDKSYFLVY